MPNSLLELHFRTKLDLTITPRTMKLYMHDWAGGDADRDLRNFLNLI